MYMHMLCYSVHEIIPLLVSLGPGDFVGNEEKRKIWFFLKGESGYY